MNVECAGCQCRVWAARVVVCSPAVLTGAAAANNMVQKWPFLYKWGFSPVVTLYWDDSCQPSSVTSGEKEGRKGKLLFAITDLILCS